VLGFHSVRLLLFHQSANLVWHPVLYGFSLAYLFAPSAFSSANIIEFAAGQPEWVKVAEKTILAAPFAFHSLNGLRHLAWDTGKCLSSSTPLFAM
jgi:succinate dehydrogenase (ubiquinone) cytochrome b560 subunit